MILDTCYLLDLKDRDQSAFSKALVLSEQDIEQRITLPTIYELFYGVHYTSNDEERRKVNNLLLMYHIYKHSEEVAKRASSLKAEADNNGNSNVEDFDAIIGAVAEKLDEPVLTINTNDFSELGIPYETY